MYYKYLSYLCFINQVNLEYLCNELLSTVRISQRDKERSPGLIRNSHLFNPSRSSEDEQQHAVAVIRMEKLRIFEELAM